jgi:hypothetical protein
MALINWSLGMKACAFCDKTWIRVYYLDERWLQSVKKSFMLLYDINLV